MAALSINIKLIRLYLGLISLILLPMITLCNSNTSSYEECIKTAIKNSFIQGSIKYKMVYRILGSNGDTLSINSLVTAIISKDKIDFTASYNDSLLAIYLDNQLLSVNLNNKTFQKSLVKQNDIQDIVDFIYPPFIERKLGKAIFSGKTVTEKLDEDKDNLMFKVKITNSGDLGEFYFLFNISKRTNTLIKYSYSASIANISIWEEFNLLSYEIMNEDSINICLKDEMNSITTNYCFIANGSTSIDADSLSLILNRLIEDLPGFDLISTKNDTLKLSDQTSRFYLVEFWFRTCYPCIRTLPILKELDAKYNDSQLLIVSINFVDKNTDVINEFIRKNSIVYSVYTSSAQKGRAFEGVTTFPYFILYDSIFNPIATFMGYRDDLLQQVEKNIGKH